MKGWMEFTGNTTADVQTENQTCRRDVLNVVTDSPLSAAQKTRAPLPGRTQAGDWRVLHSRGTASAQRPRARRTHVNLQEP